MRHPRDPGIGWTPSTWIAWLKELTLLFWVLLFAAVGLRLGFLKAGYGGAIAGAVLALPLAFLIASMIKAAVRFTFGTVIPTLISIAILGGIGYAIFYLWGVK